MPIAKRRNPGRRLLVAALVSFAHLVAFSSFRDFRWPAVQIVWRENPSELIDLNKEPPAAPPPRFRLSATQAAPAVVLELPAIDPDTLSDSSAITDWRAQGESAAAGIAAADGVSVRSFAMPERAAKPRKAQPFGWDKTHTQRVAALPEGGILIRLSDHCSLILAPLPLGGCSLGKIEARGDLFDGMKAPVELGDWRDSAASPIKQNH